MASVQGSAALNGLTEEERKDVLKSIRNPQPEEERRKIREDYRKLKDDLAEHRQELTDPADEKDLLSENVTRVDNLFKRVRMTREGALDAAILLNISEGGRAKAQKLKTDFVTFNPAEFCEKVRVTIAGDVDHQGLSFEQWVTLGNAVQPFFKRTPVLKYMCGSFERGEVSLKKSRPAREKERDNTVEGKATKPTQLSSLEQTDRGELTTAQVENLLSTLWTVYEQNDGDPICFFEFVTNPHSFGQTVENIFYASFLIRDGHASIYLDDDKLPVIVPIQKEERGKDSSPPGRSQNQQVVLTITPSEWEEIVDTFGIEEPIIKDIRRQDVLREQNGPVSFTISETPPAYQGKGKGKGKKSIT